MSMMNRPFRAGNLGGIHHPALRAGL